jgi:hypothetical protein
MRQRYRPQAVLGLALTAVLFSGCQLTQSAFARSAGNAGAAFAAAEQTLRDAHGRITVAYATSSFVNFRSELQGLDTQLPSQSGAPGSGQIKHLLALYDTAMAAVAHPSLTASCDWKGQIAALDAASKAFLKAGGS